MDAFASVADAPPCPDVAAPLAGSQAGPPASAAWSGEVACWARVFRVLPGQPGLLGLLGLLELPQQGRREQPGQVAEAAAADEAQIVFVQDAVQEPAVAPVALESAWAE